MDYVQNLSDPRSINFFSFYIFYIFNWKSLLKRTPI